MLALNQLSAVCRLKSETALPKHAVQARINWRSALWLCLACFAFASGTVNGDSSGRKVPPPTSTFWSLQPVQSPAPPSVQAQAWPRSSIDRFVLAKLEARGLGPSPEADRATLIRRLSFDLIGLPPSPEQIDAFVQDASPGAYDDLVERLLASPQYGERWARHWLDVARYTESQGYEYDHMRPNAWHYRDYLINSFNADKPYDQFVKEQIAGDALEPVTPERIIATSLLVCGPWDQAGNGQANATQKAFTREEELEDLLSVVGQTFLGLTINCARCHDHKFDPIPQQDYYRLKSVFEGVWHGERIIATKDVIGRHEQQVAALKERVATTEKKMAELEARGRARVLNERKGSPAARSNGPFPIARWTFEQGTQDSVGAWHGTLRGQAQIAGGQLLLNGEDAFLETAEITQEISEKTLEVWLALSNLEQRGGGAISLEDADGKAFDAIVFGELQPKKWIAGSEHFARSKNLPAPPESSGQLIHMAAVYAKDGSIALYREGKPYGQAYTPQGPPKVFKAGQARILIGKRHTGGSNPYLRAAIEQASVYDRALTAEEIEASMRSSGWHVSNQEALAALTPEESAQRGELSQALDRARDDLKNLPPLPVSYAGIRKEPEPTKLLRRGDVRTPGETVTPGGLSAVAALSSDFGLAADAPEAARRLKLAEWITDPRNPLTARVMVNRVWHYHFGSGLVDTPNDLGASGSKPTHPELLDWLAARFAQSGWKLKSLHRLIVSSATYRQASAHRPEAARIDSDNQRLWRFPPKRLEAEALRDAILAASGRLNLEQFGPSFRPFDTKSFNATFYYPADKIGAGYDRRTVYRMNINSGKDPLLDAFDCPDPSTKTPRRGVTTTPLQALGLMNNSFVQRQADHLARRVLSETGGDSRRALDRAYRYTLGRLPTEREASRGLAAAEATSLQNVCWALFNSTEFLYVQ